MGDRSWRCEKHQAQDGTRLMQMPKEIVMNILSRICWKFLLKSVRHVCKKWYFLIKDNDEFAHLHMKRTRISSSSFELAAITYEESHSLFHTDIYSILTDSDNNFIRWRNFDTVKNAIHVDGELSIDYNFIGSINGLICLHKVNTNTALVFNPLTKQMVTLPPNKSYKLPGPSWSNVPNDEYGVDLGWLTATGFWFCDVNKEYKIVHVYLLDPMLVQDHDDHVIEVEMISLGLDHCWRNPKTKHRGGNVRPRRVPVGNAVVLGNVMYWLGYPVRPTYIAGATSCVTEIVWFDVWSEEFGSITCPNVEDYNVCYNQRLLVGVDHELCLVSHCVPRWNIKSRYGNIELVLWTLKHPNMWVEECRYFVANRHLQDRFSGALCIRHNAYVVHYFCEIDKCWYIVLKKGDEDHHYMSVLHTKLAVVPYQPTLVSPPTMPLPTPN